MNRHLRTAVAAALFIVATLLVFVPELRGPTLRTALWGLWLVVVGPYMVRAFRGGMLTKTPKQIYTGFRVGTYEPAGASALEAAASVMAMIAGFVVH